MAYEDYRPIVISITPDTNAYTSGDVVGGLLTPTLTTVPTVITGVSVAVGEASKALTGTLYFYNATPTSFADNAAFAPVHADNQKMFAYVTLPTAITLNSRNIYQIRYGGGSTMPLIEVSSQFYIYYVTTSATTFSAAQNVTVTLYQMGAK